MGLLLLAIIIFRQQGEDFTKPQFSLEKRIVYWQETLDIIFLHPLKGIGLGNFNLAQTRFAHNSYLQLWAEAGILGLLSYLSLIFIFLKKGIRSIRNNAEGFYSGFFVAGLVFIIHNLVDFTFFIPQVSFLWWISLGCVLGHSDSNKT
jgi:O-antigen ligase